MAHGVEKCVHDVVVRQCRCFQHTDVRIVSCDPQLCGESSVQASAARTPVITDHVHYIAYGTPGGEYRKVCRAAVVTEVGQWVTISTDDSASADPNYRVRYLTQRFFDDAVALFVMNPTGVFLNGAGPVACRHVEPTADGDAPPGGTWHWPDHG